jgi:hypothetical protein
MSVVSYLDGCVKSPEQSVLYIVSFVQRGACTEYIQMNDEQYE